MEEHAIHSDDDGASNMSPADGLKTDQPRYVVGLGASAGGLEALERFFANAPTDSGATFVVVMHLARDFKSVLDELLARHTQMPVRPIVDGLPLAADTVYVIQPGTEVEIAGPVFKAATRPLATSTGRVSSIDALFRSMASTWGEKCAAVVLSGSGSDGAHGVVAVHEAGGLVVAQAPETAKFDAMPIAAISTNRVSGVETPDALAAMVIEGLQLPKISPSPRRASETEPALRQILSAVVGSSQLDAAQYTHSIFERRVQRRMRELHIGSVEDYANLVGADRNEARTLSETLLIGVTDFFRDESAFTSIERMVVPELVRRAHDENRPIRVWVVGCASGEEAYSLAMLLAEASADVPTPVAFQIFATDVHKALLSEAARGEYTAEQMQNVSESRRRAFFTRTPSGTWQIDAKLRKSLVFSPHDVLSDAPFTRLDLVSCRNLLIYFSIEAQQRVLGSFAFGLLERGFLFLGASETVGAQRESFEFVDVRRRIFRRVRSSARSPALSLRSPDWSSAAAPPTARRASARSREAALLPAYSALLREFAPPSLLVNSARELLHVFGQASQFLRAPEGAVRLEANEMLDPALRTPLTAGLERAFREREVVTFARIELAAFPARGMLVDLSIRPLVGEGGEPLFALVLLQEVKPLAARPISPELRQVDPGLDTRVAELEIELLRTREALQATIEEIEATNEELQSTNEELLSANEELQSTNEELSSLNEELHSVNAEHFRQNDELLRLTRDFDALLHATEIGVVFFDTELKIRRFTRLVGELFHFTDVDIGRPLATFRSPFNDFDLESFLLRVLRVGQVEEMEAKDQPGRTWRLRAASYPDHQGIVLSVIGANLQRDGVDLSRTTARDRFLARAAPFAGDPVIVVDPATGRVDFANDAALLRMGVRDENLANGLQAARLTPEWGDSAWVSWLSTILPGGDNTRLDVSVFDAKGEVFLADLRATVIGEPNGRRAVVRVVENRDRAAALRELQERSRMFAISNRELEQFATVVAHDLRGPLRHLNQFAGFLSAELGSTATPNVAECLQIIQSSVANMSGMVERLLDYARIGAGAPSFAPVELSECLAQAMELLHSEIVSANATIEGIDLGRINGDRLLLVRLFQNLLGNALKYRRKDVQPAIRVVTTQTDAAIQIRVYDKGIGIDPANSEVIFKMFNRLHTDQEYTGHGMGLSICRRVCEIHGGTIQLEPGSDVGSCFLVTLPRSRISLGDKPL
jgi:two-component system CheB/CheR fusion protein